MLHRLIHSHLFLCTYVLSIQIVAATAAAAATTNAYSRFNSSFTPDHLRYLKNETKALFQHAWSSYINYGFPADEVRPLTCEPYGPDYKDVTNTVRNDAMANISSTMLDNLDTLIIMGQWDELESALKYLKTNQKEFFNQDTIVQVFEATIRFLGGLLSTHLILTDVIKVDALSSSASTTKARSAPPPPLPPTSLNRLREISANYDGFLLGMAHDLGLRLIPSYRTRTNIPVPRINLAKGLKDVPPPLQKDACTSGVTTPVLEFTLLSRLTGDYQFEYYSQLAFWKIWSSKSQLNLLPMTIDPFSNQWKDSITGIGASIDSFYEYAAKSAILFDDDHMWSVFKTSYQALLTHSAQSDEGSMIFPNINNQDGVLFSDWIDSLSAFWSGLQVLTGQLTDAIKTHVVYLKIWDHFDSIPERWIYSHRNSKKNRRKIYRAEDSIELEWYPLRPEFIESTYYLYRATRDPMYLHIGERILYLFQNTYKAPCGFSGFQDVRTGQKQNRMETFVLGETLKYLYLLFDVEDEAILHNKVLMRGKNWIFSTEAHPLWYHKNLYNRSAQGFLGAAGEESKINPAIIRNTTIVKPELFEIPDGGSNALAHVTKKDPYGSRFDTCQLNPLGKAPNSFLESSFYNWDHLFKADYTFQNSLKKPRHVTRTNLDGSYIELSRSFYDKFTMFQTPLICPRMPTTHVYEIFWGDIKEATRSEVSLLKVSDDATENKIIYNDDLWVPNLSGLRIQFEELKVDDIDAKNKVITIDYLHLLLHGSNSTQPVDTGLKGLRVRRVNGVDVKLGAAVWTLPFQVNEKDKDTVQVTEGGRVVLEGKIVENLMVWYG
ncbi:hypothetical protein PVL30_001239 [Lodderomyces elongisporus]|uniref:uncharacterized protein n=1 Tax=Lodderomyces elongisporus TaxID=36914 RepID=UPI002921FAC4|nr:uncharacterized protein PVL30_001239 [Lodderomyces elongisporus]WLF77521.1 hypothetical protein PVL30_001239 [Lodderomyces elongisporus]